ncbi:MAG: 6-bladed beta-propeller [Ignavibacteriales bacterium]|nr:6-bladed beta-propeller [Ignavibacteriales bacterium]
MKKLLYLLAIFIIYFIGCKENKNNVEHIKFSNKNISSNLLNFQGKIEITNSKDYKTYSIYKLIELNDTSFLFLDPYSTSIFFVEKNKIIKRIGNKGNGPGEFASILDFTLDNEKNIYVLDIYGHKVGKFDSQGNFIKNFQLSFNHRTPSKIKFYKNYFIISAENNLENGATKDKFSFLEYKNVSYLNVYDKEFNYIKSFLNPSKEFYHTYGTFARPFETFVTFCECPNYLLAISQEGFYRINKFSKELNLENIIEINDESFIKIDKNKISSYKLINQKPNFSEMKIGEIIGNHTVPVNMLNSAPFLIIEFREPMENYFPQYVENYSYNFHYDLFRVSSTKLEPLASNIKIKGRLIGVGEVNSFYFTENTVEKDTLKYLTISKYNIK